METRILIPRVLEVEAEVAAVGGDAAAQEPLLHEALAKFEATRATGHARRLSKQLTG
jgi:hypothetical protein